MKSTVILLLVLFLFVSCTKDEKIESNSCGGSQYTCIRDSNFEQVLIELGIDSDGFLKIQIIYLILGHNPQEERSKRAIEKVGFLCDYDLEEACLFKGLLK